MMDADIFRRALTGEITAEEAADLVAARTAAHGSAPSAHEVARGADEAAITPPAPAGPVEWNPHLRPGDISPADYQRLSMAQIDELERVSPGIGERIDAAARWAAESERTAALAAEKAEKAEYDRRYRTDPAFAAAELAKHARAELEQRWWSTGEQERQLLAAEAGMTAEQYAELGEQIKARSGEAIRRPTVSTGGLL